MLLSKYNQTKLKIIKNNNKIKSFSINSSYLKKYNYFTVI